MELRSLCAGELTKTDSALQAPSFKESKTITKICSKFHRNHDVCRLKPHFFLLQSPFYKIGRLAHLSERTGKGLNVQACQIELAICPTAKLVKSPIFRVYLGLFGRTPKLNGPLSPSDQIAETDDQGISEIVYNTDELYRNKGFSNSLTLGEGCCGIPQKLFEVHRKQFSIHFECQ